jgi:Raf kinase inhibitor-like YbhB/YbcL family protein
MAGAIAVLAACASDGRDMKPPTYPLPPITTAPPSTAPLGAVSPDLVEAPITTPAVMQLVAPWPDLGAIPARNTCDDLDVAPALTWSGVPAGTTELALTLTDLDADLTHWIAYAIDPTTTGVAEGELPAGAFTFANELGSSDWVGPCPPAADSAHRYMLTLTALNQQLEFADDATSDEVVATLNQNAIAQSSVTGTYARGT